MALEDSLYDFYNLFAPLSLVRDLYQEELLTTLTLSAAAIALAMMLIYYYVLNGTKPRFDGMGSWLLLWLTSGLLTFVVVVITCFQKEQDELPRSENKADGLLFDQGFGTFSGFAIEVLVLAMVLFFVFSVLGKNFSVHAYMRPFKWPRK
jgi:magnesium-transporting ATPase (P-type)